MMLSMLAAAPASQSARAFGYEIWYFDDYENLVGTYTVPACGGPPIMEGYKTNIYYVGWQESCSCPCP
jgi:hypothetical protein